MSNLANPMEVVEVSAGYETTVPCLLSPLSADLSESPVAAGPGEAGGRGNGGGSSAAGGAAAAAVGFSAPPPGGGTSAPPPPPPPMPPLSPVTGP